MNQRKMIWRDVAVHGELGQAVHRLSPIRLSAGGGVGLAECRAIKRTASGKFQSLFCRLDGFVQIVRVPENPGESHQSIRKLRHCVEHVSVSRDRFVKPACVVVTPAERLEHTGRQRIELACKEHLIETLIETPFHHEVKRVPVMAGRVIWIDLDGAAVQSLGYGPVEVMTNSGEAERAVSFRRSWIELDGFGSVLFSGGRSFGKGSN